MSRRIPRAVSLAASVAWGELRQDPARAALLGLRLLPRGCGAGCGRWSGGSAAGPGRPDRARCRRPFG
ncbi:hypothetical protein ACFQ3Z_37240 [Streptomyces nogalater]